MNSDLKLRFYSRSKNIVLTMGSSKRKAVTHQAVVSSFNLDFKFTTHLFSII